MSAAKILIVEDELIVQLHLRQILETLGYRVTGVAAGATEALAHAAECPPDLALMDISLRGKRDGIDTARDLQGQFDTSIVFLTAYADEATVKRTESVGAMGYIVKPFSKNEVRAVIATALALRDQFRSLNGGRDVREDGLPALSQRPDDSAEFHGMIGRCLQMRDVFDRIEKLARIHWSVLIEGETGTGKELTARAIHRESDRFKKPFVPVNCAGLTETLLTSLLFGHRRGTFTGAVDDQLGLFEAASGGVLFLDEIADVSMNGQQALLRVLEDGMVRRVGETKTRSVDVRIVSATQRDLAGEVAAGRFRADLLFRLRAARLSLPPLRERVEDIPLLVGSFLPVAARTAGRPVKSIGKAAFACLQRYSWPGNVRELKNIVDHAVLSCTGTTIQPEDLPPEVVNGWIPDIQGQDPADERQRILLALRRSSGNRTEAARLLGISRATLYRRFNTLGISDE